MPSTGIREFTMLRHLCKRNIHHCWYALCGLLGLVAVGWTYAAVAQSDEFAAWLAVVRAEALTLGIRPQTLDTALNEVRLQPLVIELDRKQPERTITYTQYLARALPKARVQRGSQLLRRYQTLLHEIAARYGVAARFVVALWGIESNFGQTTGDFPVLASLATLAYDGRRSALFRRELFEALQIIDEGHIRPQEMIGSWAGAMGQSQFMPSSFRQFAVDYDGDGRRDIWGSLPDVFASIANYLARSGWHREEPWGQQVTLPSSLSAATTDLEASRPLTEWQALGVRRVNGEALPAQSVAAALVSPDGPGGPAFLVQHNYRILLTWNRSHYFATTVGQFADQMQE